MTSLASIGHTDFLNAFVLGSLSAVVEAPKDSDVLLQGASDDLRDFQAGSFPQLVQVLDVPKIKTHGRSFSDGLHTAHSLQGADTVFDVAEHAKVHSIYTCNTSDIRIKPESSDFVKSLNPLFGLKVSALQSNSLPRIPLPLEWILGQKELAIRVMERLQLAESREPEPYYQQHIRQAWIIVSFLHKGTPDAFVQSSYVVYGVHPDYVWPNIVADRKARLGVEYHDFYDSADVLRPDIAKFSPTPADTHAANRADSANWVGPFPPFDKEVEQ